MLYNYVMIVNFKQIFPIISLGKKEQNSLGMNQKKIDLENLPDSSVKILDRMKEVLGVSLKENNSEEQLPLISLPNFSAPKDKVEAKEIITKWINDMKSFFTAYERTSNKSFFKKNILEFYLSVFVIDSYITKFFDNKEGRISEKFNELFGQVKARLSAEVGMIIQSINLNDLDELKNIKVVYGQFFHKFDQSIKKFKLNINKEILKCIEAFSPLEPSIIKVEKEFDSSFIDYEKNQQNKAVLIESAKRDSLLRGDKIIQEATRLSDDFSSKVKKIITSSEESTEMLKQVKIEKSRISNDFEAYTKKIIDNNNYSKETRKVIDKIIGIFINNLDQIELQELVFDVESLDKISNIFVKQFDETNNKNIISKTVLIDIYENLKKFYNDTRSCYEEHRRLIERQLKVVEEEKIVLEEKVRNLQEMPRILEEILDLLIDKEENNKEILEICQNILLSFDIISTKIQDRSVDFNNKNFMKEIEQITKICGNLIITKIISVLKDENAQAIPLKKKAKKVLSEIKSELRKKSDSSKEIDFLRENNKALIFKNSELKKIIDKIKKQIYEKTNDGSSTELQIQMRKLKEIEQKYFFDLEKLDKRNKSLLQERNDLQSKLDRLETELKEKSRVIFEKDNFISSLKAKLDTMKKNTPNSEEINFLKKQKEEANEIIEKLNISLEKQQELNRDASKNFKQKLEGQKEYLEGKFLEDIGKLKEEREELLKKIKILSEEILKEKQDNLEKKQKVQEMVDSFTKETKEYFEKIVNNLNQKIEKLEKENSSLKDSNEESKEIRKKDEDLIRKLEDEYSLITIDHNSLKKDYESVFSEFQNSKIQLEENSKQIKNYSTEIKKLQREKEVLTKDYESIYKKYDSTINKANLLEKNNKEKIRDQKHLIEQKDKLIEELNKKVITLEEERDSLKENLKITVQEYNNLVQEVKTKLLSFNKKSEELKSNNKSLEEQLKTTLEENRLLEKKMSEDEKKHSLFSKSSEKEKTKLIRKNEKLEKDLDNLKEKFIVTEEELLKVKSTLSFLNQQKDDSEQKISSLEKQTTDLTTELKQKLEEIENLSTKEKLNISENEQLKKEEEIYESKIKQLQQTNEMHVEKNESIENDIKNLLNVNNNLEKKHIILRNKTRSLEQHIKGLEEQIKHMSAKLLLEQKTNEESNKEFSTKKEEQEKNDF